MAASSSRRDRRGGSRRTAEVEPELKPELAGGLIAAGWTVRPRGRAESPSPGPPAILEVIGGEDPATTPSARCLAILCPTQRPEILERAAALTPFVYPRELPCNVLVRLLTQAAETWGRGHRRSGPPPRPLLLLDLHEMALELDGVPLALAVAERNFLMSLAFTGWMSKDATVEAGAGQRVAARECRRRLGKRLGSGLAGLLVPELRGEPYRLATPEESERLGGIRLRVVGRSEVRRAYLPDVEGFAGDES